MALDHGWQISFRILDEAHSGFEHLVATAGDALDRGPGDDVGDNANERGGAVIRIVDAEAADDSTELAGQRYGGNVAIGAGRGTADNHGIGHRPQCHGRVFGRALGCLIDQDEDSAAVVNGAGLDERAVAELERTRIGQIGKCKADEWSRLGCQVGAHGERHEVRRVVADVDDQAFGVLRFIPMLHPRPSDGSHDPLRSISRTLRQCVA
jgi:hypothetical protein